ncbi:hypothetical protein KCU78_g8429, partial [Aureobasidium melanogenum]
MGDPFTIAVSVAGLTSLGIQLAQGLKKYADSALDSKGRILAISIDIELAVQVLKTLDATLQNSSSRVSMTDDAEKLAKDVIKQCQDLFAAIEEMLPNLKPIGLVYGCRDAALTFELIKKVKRHGKITLKYLQACLMDSVALRKIEQQAKASHLGYPRDHLYEASYADYLIEPEETRVICGIPRHKSGHAPVALELETRPSRLRIQALEDGQYASAAVGMLGSQDTKWVERPTTPPVAYAVPSVDDLVRHWTTIRSNDVNIDSGAASSSDGQPATD